MDPTDSDDTSDDVDCAELVELFGRGRRNLGTLRTRLRAVASSADALQESLTAVACGAMEDAAGWPRGPDAMEMALMCADAHGSLGRLVAGADAPLARLEAEAAEVAALIEKRAALAKEHEACFALFRRVDAMAAKRRDAGAALAEEVAATASSFMRSLHALDCATDHLRAAAVAFDGALEGAEADTVRRVAEARLAHAEKASRALSAAVDARPPSPDRSRAALEEALSAARSDGALDLPEKPPAEESRAVAFFKGLWARGGDAAETAPPKAALVEKPVLSFTFSDEATSPQAARVDGRGGDAEARPREPSPELARPEPAEAPPPEPAEAPPPEPVRAPPAPREPAFDRSESRESFDCCDGVLPPPEEPVAEAAATEEPVPVEEPAVQAPAPVEAPTPVEAPAAERKENTPPAAEPSTPKSKPATPKAKPPTPREDLTYDATIAAEGPLSLRLEQHTVYGKNVIVVVAARPGGLSANAGVAVGSRLVGVNGVSVLNGRRTNDADYYGVLGVGPDADRAAIRRAYKRTSLKTHPDKAGGHKALFVEVTRAYAVLSDKQLRRDYDLCCSGADAPDFQKALALIKASKRPLTLHLVRPVA